MILSDFQYQPDGPTLKRGQIVHFVRNLVDPTLYTAFKLGRQTADWTLANISIPAPARHTLFLEEDVRAVVYRISLEVSIS